MAKNTTKIIAGALAVFGVYFIIKYFKKPTDDSKKTETEPAPPTPTPIGSGYPLKKGSKGRSVSSLQQWILKIDKTLLPKYGADGSFGSETEAAVQKLLGKKTVDSNADFDRLMFIYNQKTFPLMTNVPKQPDYNTLPIFPNYGTKK